MSDSSRIERTLPRILEDLGAGPPPDYTMTLLARTSTTRQRPAWTFGSVPVHGAGAGGSIDVAPSRPWGLIAVVALVAVAILAGTLLVGGLRAIWPDDPGLARGRLVYATGGDIYLGDPVTGSSDILVSGMPFDSQPVFSPDGSRIAFRRAEAADAGGAAVLVMRPDGSAPVIIAPGLVDPAVYAWMPDGSDLAVYEDGRLLEFDADGRGAPRELVPAGRLGQLTGQPGQLAALIGPIRSEVLLTECERLTLVDPERSAVRVVVERSWPPFGRPGRCDAPSDPAWSPDGSRIAFIDRIESDPFISKAWVVDADGTDLRRLAGDPPLERGYVTEHLPMWSPDGSLVALVRHHDRGVGNRGSDWITIVDAATGAERTLDATRVMAVGIAGWSWSPDGRSILVLGEARTRPLIIDIATGRATELPWVADDLPSWQPLPTD
jgi:dipeptidyl aminopeptidase/acylaminoacyl peptidase